MKIAISSNGKTLDDEVDVRFGRCPYFLIVEIDGKEVKNFTPLENNATGQAGGAGITAAQIVADSGVEAIITVNMGPRAFDVFSQLGIKIFLGQGKIKDVVRKFLRGELKEITAATGPQHKGIE